MTSQMKSLPKAVCCFLATLLILQLASAQEAVFRSPDLCQVLTYQEHLDFLAKTEIKDYDPNGEYWVLIATVNNHMPTYPKVLSLLGKSRGATRNSSTTEQLQTYVKAWNPVLFWPKYFVKAATYEDHVYDGSKNPGRNPKPMMLLLVKVDSKTSIKFDNWLQTAKERGFPGIESRTLPAGAIIARREILFR
ncbi:MAG: hypothetical protein AAF587_15685 [Bacteroidota bacterium]